MQEDGASGVTWRSDEPSVASPGAFVDDRFPTQAPVSETGPLAAEKDPDNRLRMSQSIKLWDKVADWLECSNAENVGLSLPKMVYSVRTREQVLHSHPLMIGN